jgi:hypothetical protein
VEEDDGYMLVDPRLQQCVDCCSQLSTVRYQITSIRNFSIFFTVFFGLILSIILVYFFFIIVSLMASGVTGTGTRMVPLRVF